MHRITHPLCPCHLLSVQLLHKLRISAVGSNTTLLRVIKNPIQAHLPAGAPIIGTHMKAELIAPLKLLPTLPEGPVVFVFGAMARGFIEADYTDRMVSFSSYPLSAATAVARLLHAAEFLWDIL